MRSIRKALLDASVLVDALSISRDELTEVSVNSYGAITIQVKLEALARLFIALGVPRSRLKARSSGGWVHASFTARQAKFCACRQLDPEQWEAMLRHQTPALPPATKKLELKQPRLEFAK